MKAQPSAAWRDAFLKELKPLTTRGDYAGALRIARRGLEEYPDEFVCRHQYAKLLGDWADELPPARRKKLKREAVSILGPLRRKLKGRPLAQRFGVCLNYYYQKSSWRPMHAYGLRLARTNRQLGAYAQGLGAGLEAFALKEKKKEKESRRWAERSVRAWKKYNLKGEKYYFAHYCFAKSLALSGEKEAALLSLKKAARLGKRPLSDWEFADVRALL